MREHDVCVFGVISLLQSFLSTLTMCPATLKDLTALTNKKENIFFCVTFSFNVIAIFPSCQINSVAHCAREKKFKISEKWQS